MVLPASETVLEPHLAVAAPDGSGWQLLVRSEAAGIEPDKRGVLAGWEATPHQRFERLLRETGVGVGLLVTDNAIRLVYAPSGGETSGWLDIPIRPLATVAGRAMLGGLKLLLDRHRLFGDASSRRLPALLEASRRSQAEVSSRLAEQVLGALHELLRGLHAAAPSEILALARVQPGLLYEGLLAVLLRLVFLLYAEDRGLIPSQDDPAARAFYDQGYGVRTLHARLLEDEGRHRDTMDERRGAWHRLLVLFRLVHRGDATGWMRGRGGKLFDPATFPFLKGQSAPGDPILVPPVSDGCVFRVLDGLLMLDGERLSYRALDVEQIGSVYETVMGFRAEAASGPSLAIRAGKRDRTPVFVNLAALAAEPPKERLKWLKEHTERGKFPSKVEKGILAATDGDGLAAALLDIVDERGSPHGRILPASTPLLQPTAERRRTGSHYTPRDLTSPIVRHALEPAFERIGAAATPDAVLSLKVCDPAMGSGAFLVEACRQLATRLTEAWRVHPAERPALPPDEDEDLHARRLVVQRCIYGVDRNPIAADLARLSLWLATLARDHEFTFLDHALKSGDSLVGLSLAQIGNLRWQDGQKDVAPFSGFIRDRIKEVSEGRRRIREAPDDEPRHIQEQRYHDVEEKAAQVRLLGDAVLASFFGAGKAKAREDARKALGVTASLASDQRWPRIEAIAATLTDGSSSIRPFHWELEFSEVFAGSVGFDAIVGNPPFAGKNTLINGHRANYLDWLQTLHPDAHGNADLVSHFFRRAFALLRPGGCFGLIATNTIGQGDTRESGLRAVIAGGGSITRAIRRLPWPGEAAVIVSVVHVSRGFRPGPVLDERTVRRISAYLVEGELDSSPASLVANTAKAFAGSFLLGMGFTFDDIAASRGETESLATMDSLIRKNPRNVERIFPYIGGDDINTDPRQAHRRFAIDFFDRPLGRSAVLKSWNLLSEAERSQTISNGLVPVDYPGEVAEDWPDLIEIVRRRVKPHRDKQGRQARKARWWQYAEKSPGLYSAIAPMQHILAMSRVSAHLAFVRLPPGMVYSIECNVFALSDWASFSVLQSRLHETWVRFFASTLEDRLRYTPADCFRTFPLPPNLQDHTALEVEGEIYHSLRAQFMQSQNEGLTKVYNRFHDPDDKTPDIRKLRALHHDIDVAVLRAYGWDDLARNSAAEFLAENDEQDHRYQGRFFWPASFREVVLARLLDLNAERASEERRLGLTQAPFFADGDAELEDAD